jgi:hypothetical protein
VDQAAKLLRRRQQVRLLERRDRTFSDPGPDRSHITPLPAALWATWDPHFADPRDPDSERGSLFLGMMEGDHSRAETEFELTFVF